MKNKSAIILLSVFSILFASCNINSEKYTIVISLDSFRYDYPDSCATPNLNKIAEAGSYATVWSAYPSKTIPNQFSVATGLRPIRHGIVDNRFWDDKDKRYYDYSRPDLKNDLSFYKGTPIWNHLKENGIKSGILYWAGADIAFNGSHPDYYITESSSEKIMTPEEQVDTIISWLKYPKENRPRLIMSYMKDIDNITGTYGPETSKAYEYATKMDQVVGKLMQEIEKLPFAKKVNLIILSNQGKAMVSPYQTVNIYDYIKPEWIRVIEGTNPLFVYSIEEYRDSIVDNLFGKDHIYVFKNEMIPDELLYRGNSSRCGDIMIATEIGWQFSHVADNELRGENGFFPVYSDMRTIFRAQGPDFRQNYDGREFFNVDIYPMLEKIFKVEHKKVNGFVRRVEDLFTDYKEEVIVVEQ